jgi:hypothetical protein
MLFPSLPSVHSTVRTFRTAHAGIPNRLTQPAQQPLWYATSVVSHFKNHSVGLSQNSDGRNAKLLQWHSRTNDEKREMRGGLGDRCINDVSILPNH